jgi:hypothetical protein
MRKETPEFPEKLGCQGFIVAYNQSRQLYSFDDLGHGKCFARTCYTLESLILVSGPDSIGKSFNGITLISCRTEWRYYFKGTHFLLIHKYR